MEDELENEIEDVSIEPGEIMTTSVSDLVDAIATGEYADADKAFADNLETRIADALDQAKVAVANNVYDLELDDTLEDDLDEISDDDPDVDLEELLSDDEES